MPPKKAPKAPAAPRRSARLASREPSQEAPVAPPPAENGPPVPKRVSAGEAPAWSAERTISSLLDSTTTQQRVKAVRGLTRIQLAETALGLVSRVEDAEDAIAVLEKENSGLQTDLEAAKKRERPSIRRDFGLAQIQAKYDAKVAAGLLPAPGAEENQPTATAPPPAIEAPRPEVVTPKSPVSPSEAEKTTTQQTPAAPSSIFSKVVSTLGYFTSPFARKRPAEEATSEPSQKRMRMQEVQRPEPAQHQQESPGETAKGPQTISPTLSPAQPQPPHAMTPSSKRAAEEDDADTGMNRPPKRLRAEEPQRTPQSSHNQRQSPRDFVGPSSKNPKQPTSLSTITEYTEPSHFSIFSDSTPSKHSRIPSRGLQAPQNTPMLPSRSSQGTDDQPDAPSSTLTTSSLFQGTPRQGSFLRRSALLRARREAMKNTPSTPKLYSWEKRIAQSAPREPNADARLEKIQRLRDLERQIQELKEDEDIKDIQAHSIHNRKRVKIDDLAIIPHNRPGDSASTFRVPEPDSDDEIEVECSVDMSSNTFDEAEKTQEQAQSKEQSKQNEQPQQFTAPQPNFPAKGAPMFNFPDVGKKPVDSNQQVAAPQATRTFNFPNVAPKPSESVQQDLQVEASITFNFPHVAARPSDYYVTEEYKERAGDLFTKGYNEWMAARLEAN